MHCTGALAKLAIGRASCERTDMFKGPKCRLQKKYIQGVLLMHVSLKANTAPKGASDWSDTRLFPKYTSTRSFLKFPFLRGIKRR
jgi:hypothetical protein